MIQSFGDPEAEKIFHQERSKKLPPDIQKRALVKLLMIDASIDGNDLRIPPSNRFEHLKGSLKGLCSIRINDQWRIVFKYKDGDALEVSIGDYHEEEVI
jgi:proteic killer suppression protein